MTVKKRIGILSSGSITPGMNAAIRAAVRTVYSNGDEVIAIENGFDGFFDRDLISQPHWSYFQGLLYRGGTILGLPKHGDPYNYPVIRGDKIVHIDKSDSVLATIEDFNIDSMIVIGDLHDIEVCKKLSESGVKIVVIPNFICNDFIESNLNFGFNTAVQTAASYLDRLHTTAESHNRVFIVEVIGLHTGWLALESGIAGGADVILLPEQSFYIDSIVKTLEERARRNAPFSLIVAASGAKPADMKDFTDKEPITNYLVSKLKPVIDQDIRCLSLVLIQRGGSPIAFDRILASQYGSLAAEQTAKKIKKSKVIVYNDDFRILDLDKANLNLKPLEDHESNLIRTTENLSISLGGKE